MMQRYKKGDILETEHGIKKPINRSPMVGLRLNNLAWATPSIQSSSKIKGSIKK